MGAAVSQLHDDIIGDINEARRVTVAIAPPVLDNTISQRSLISRTVDQRQMQSGALSQSADEKRISHRRLESVLGSMQHASSDNILSFK
ncbi:hypothetical protein SS50377_24974 [Spironucleus salmonicida]|uniref:Uncharacterized protein n=1 Tax=Spironucleus salmonicida TaxID=348837 RepID=A0A9P8LRG6_9EUKA|nr:hypothetical protein SS50377_24965 [Spironucleus salmonicida]KAH0572859.1 hypothetical protein SS50377_24974 [Spironucleus salmonicida]